MISKTSIHLRFVYILILFIFIFDGTYIFGQNPGYLGKKLMFGYNYKLGIYPSVYGVMLDFKFPETYNHHAATLEYVFSKRMSLGLRVGITQLQVIDKSGLPYYYLAKNNMGWTERYQLQLFQNGWKTNVYTIGIDYDLYRKNYIAPVGLYHQFGLQYNFFKEKNYYNQISDTLDVNRSITSGYLISVSYFMGRKKIINDNFYYSFGGKFVFGISPYTFLSNYTIFDTHLGYNIHNRNPNLDALVFTKLSESVIVSLEFGIGFIFPNTKTKER